MWLHYLVKYEFSNFAPNAVTPTTNHAITYYKENVAV